jgi:hypothetical protein
LRANASGQFHVAVFLSHVAPRFPSCCFPGLSRVAGSERQVFSPPRVLSIRMPQPLAEIKAESKDATKAESRSDGVQMTQLPLNCRTTICKSYTGGSIAVYTPTSKRESFTRESQHLLLLLPHALPLPRPASTTAAADDTTSAHLPPRSSSPAFLTPPTA